MDHSWPPWIPLLSGWRVAPEPRPGEITRWPVYRETARFRRQVGYLEGNFPGQEIPPLPGGVPDALQRLFRRSKRVDEKQFLAALAPAAAQLALTPESLARRLVAEGWLGRWVRLLADEKSVRSVEYGPGAPLAALLRAGLDQARAENRRWLREMTGRMGQLRAQVPSPAGAKVLGVAAEALGLAGEGLDREPGEVVHPLFPWAFHPSKPKGRFHLGVEFLLALAGCLVASPGGFEWKEIGARFSPGIGGSKRFDAARDDLLALAEAASGIPPEELGLTSTGGLYCLYFLGPLTAHFPGVSLAAGPAVGALTNVQMGQMTGLATAARRVVLTENRALLLKMASTGWPRENPPTLVLGIDGRLRLAHTRFLRLLQQSCPRLPWFAWVDTDAAGLGIAGQVAAVNAACRFLLPPPQAAVLDYAAWRRALASTPALADREQEDNLGQPPLWHEWFRI